MSDQNDNSVQIALLNAKVDALELAVEAQTKQMAELLQAWNTASGVLAFVKMIGSIALAITALVAVIKGFKL